MFRKILFALFLVSVPAASGIAADRDNTAASPSYFEGVWVGSWRGFYDPGSKQDITVTIEKGAREGVFLVDYSWGMVQSRNRTTHAGSLKSKGRQEGDQFIFQWKTKQGDERKITLQKETVNRVKARVDRGGTLPPNESPVSETYLDRK